MRRHLRKAAHTTWTRVRTAPGTWLCLAAVAAHVGATLVSEGILNWAVQHGRTHQAAARTLDVGGGYALSGVAAALTYRITPHWRPPYVGAVLIFYGVPLIAGPDFTDIGHVTAVLIGLACYPLTRGRPRTPNLDTGTESGVRTPS
ncbi:rhomboid-like protein [Streptomyces sp. NBC_01725]|uniref:rhomboid-like protein n=1 Tax=Streptomyces sp. NBC_01725 TaxID=2975923 RepID=UPI002E29845D|nr:rhomboid-like protein [Streptomyces sp. NBC_01725]